MQLWGKLVEVKIMWLTSDMALKLLDESMFFCWTVWDCKDQDYIDYLDTY